MKSVDKDREQKCMPGRTVIHMNSGNESNNDILDYGYDDNEYIDDIVTPDLRSHAYGVGKTKLNSNCQMCVCSVDGKDEVCLNRPALNVNECMRMRNIKKYMASGVPFDHTRSLYQRIRRDYIWHNDEIAYDATARCRRGVSYYTNNVEANNSEIRYELEKQLSYGNKSVCFFCVCHTNGADIVCLNRKPWYCRYMRYTGLKDFAKHMYTKYFKQDRPALFRHISHRMRRTMDLGVYDLIETGGDTLCCAHHAGHVKNLHNAVKNRIRMLKRRVPKEDLVEGDVAGDYVDFIVNNDK